MSELAIQLTPEAETVSNQALALVSQLKTFPAIKTSTDYLKAGDLFKSGKAMMKSIDDGYDGLIKSAHKLWKDALAKKAFYYDPIESGTKTIKNLMSEYDAEQERLRLAEQRRLEEIARKEAEERALQEAIAAEEEAKRNGATQEEAEQEAAAIIEQPVYVPPVEVQKTVPKVQGVVYREIWSAECFDIKALCKGVAEGRVSPECVMPNMPVLNKLATGLKSTMAVPGCRAISRRV